MKNTKEFTVSTSITREIESASKNITVHAIRLTNAHATTERIVTVTLGTSTSTKHLADIGIPGHTSIEILDRDLPLSIGKGLYFVTDGGTDVAAIITYSNY
jgi:hypothetical protein